MRALSSFASGVGALALALTFFGCDDSSDPTDSPFATEVVSYELGEGGGFGEEALPDIVLGAPRGAGDAQGSLDVLSLGAGGEITLAIELFDGPGPDLLVCENAFVVAGTDVVFAEPAFVEVSADGQRFERFECDPEASGFPGCAGVTPVLWEGDGEMPAADEVGCDAYDLSELEMNEASFVRLVDSGVGRGAVAPSRGFDLDALVSLH